MWAQSDPAVRTFAAADRLVPDWPGSDTSLEVLQCGVPACGCSRQPPRRWWLGAAIRAWSYMRWATSMPACASLLGSRRCSF